MAALNLSDNYTTMIATAETGQLSISKLSSAVASLAAASSDSINNALMLSRHVSNQSIHNQQLSLLQQPGASAAGNSGAVKSAAVSSEAVINSSSEAEPDGPFQMPLAAEVVWTLFFSVMIVNAVIGNIVVFWIVLGSPLIFPAI